MDFYQYCANSFDEQLDQFYAKQRKRAVFKYHPAYLSLHDFYLEKEKYKTDILNSIKSNNFKFDPLTPIFLPKDKNNYRMVCVPSIKDRLVQTLFISYLEKIEKKKEMLTHDFAYGEIYLNLKGVKAAHDKLKSLRKKYKYALKTDIESFFDQLDRGRILQLFDEKLGLASLKPFFYEMIKADPHIKLLQVTSEDQYKNFSEIINKKKGRGIRQGMPIASLLASFYLQDFDKVLISKGIEFVRYADDLIVFANTRDDIEKHFELIRYELSKIQLSIPDTGSGKSKIYTPSQTVIFLGLELKKVGKEFKLFIPQKSFTDISKKLIELQGYKKNIRANLNFYKTCQRIDQICNGYIVCYEFTANLDLFRKHIGERKLFVYQRLLAPLGIDYAKLNDDQKKYFFNQ